MLYTNKMKVTIKWGNVDGEFDLYQVKKKDYNYYKGNFLDHTIYTFKAKSVCMGADGASYVLLDKVEGEVFAREITKVHDDIVVKKIELCNMENNLCRKKEYETIMARLLFNQIKVPSIKAVQYNNISGKLLVPYYKGNEQTSKREYKRFFQIYLNNENVLLIQLKTFRSAEKGRYVIDDITQQIRLRLSSDVAGKAFEIGARRGVKATADLFNIKSYAKFQESKMGVLAQFLDDVQERLKDYIKLELEPLTNGILIKQNSQLRVKKQKARIEALVKSKGIIIQDLIGDEISEMSVEKVKKCLQEEFDIDTGQGGELSINILHDKEYYEVSKLEDPYGKDKEGSLVQHVSKEALSGDDISNQVYKILQELCIKSDIKDEKINIIDWPELNIEGEWSFVLREPLKGGDKNEFHYKKVRVSEDGGLEFTSHDKHSKRCSDEWYLIKDHYNEVVKNCNITGKVVEGIFYKDLDEIYTITRTGQMITPEVKEINKDMSIFNPERILEKSIIVQALAEFKLVNNMYENEIISALKSIEEMEENIPIKDIKALFNMKSSMGQKLNQFLVDNHRIIFYPAIRNATYGEKYSATYYQGIRYYKDDEINTLKYYVGTNSALKEDLPKGILIREIISTGEGVNCEEILSMMTVEFVRSKQYTVIPFIYKYLREYESNREKL